ncbi:MAG: 50S ribosomal protein L34e [Candidatus Bathyarchaeota archaeon]|nr:MAG: 50S ribosomal protein L34e [Candidatus Bathyarchaeota archaeon]
MPRPAMRTRSRKRKRHSLSGGRSKTSLREEMIGGRRCTSCGGTIPFLPRSASKIRKLPRSQKRISRSYGGQICHSCLSNSLKQALRTQGSWTKDHNDLRVQ